MSFIDAEPGYNSVSALGPAVIGMTITSILLGISCIQTSFYFKQYPHDWIVHKWVVGVVSFLNLAHVVMIVHGVYWHAVNGIAVSHIIWSFRVAMIVNTIIVVVILNLYAVWLWRIGAAFHRFVPYTVILFQIAGFGVAGVVIHASLRCIRYSDVHFVTWEVILGLGTSTAADFFIASIMGYYLKIGRTGFAGIHSQVGQLFQFIVCSGLATSAVSLSSLVFFWARPDNEIWMGIEFCLTGAYVNSFMALMNARKRMQNRTAVPFLSAMHTTIRFVDKVPAPRSTFLETHVTMEHADDRSEMATTDDDVSPDEKLATQKDSSPWAASQNLGQQSA